MANEQKQSLSAEEALLAEVLGDTLELRNQVKGLKPELDDATHKLMKAAAILIDASEKHTRNGDLIKKDISRHAALVINAAKQELAKVQNSAQPQPIPIEPQQKPYSLIRDTLLVLTAVNILINLISFLVRYAD